jgi:hypothetical protein
MHPLSSLFKCCPCAEPIPASRNLWNFEWNAILYRQQNAGINSCILQHKSCIRTRLCPPHCMSIVWEAYLLGGLMVEWCYPLLIHQKLMCCCASMWWLTNLIYSLRSLFVDLDLVQSCTKSESVKWIRGSSSFGIIPVHDCNQTRFLYISGESVAGSGKEVTVTAGSGRQAGTAFFFESMG